MSWLKDLPGIRSIFSGGVALPARSAMEFKGGVTAVDNPTTGRTEVSYTGTIGSRDTLIENGKASDLAAVFASWVSVGTGGTEALRRRVFLRGSFVFDQILDVPSWTSIDARGCNLTTTLSPNVSQADVNTNCLVRCQAFESPTVYSSLTAISKPGATKHVISSTTGFAAGDFVRVYSWNAASRPNNYLVGNEDVPVWMIYRLKAVPNSTDLTIEGVVRYWQAVGSVATKLTPIRGVSWIGGRFDCSGGSIANAFLFDGALDVRVEGATFKGFSRAAVEFSKGSRRISLPDVGHEGECNSVIYVQSAEEYDITDFRSPATASATKHANGVPRGLVTLRRRARNGTINGGHFAFGTIGIQHWAVHGLTAENLTFQNLDGNNRPASGDGQLTKRCGIAIDGGQASVTVDVPNNVDGASFSVDVTFRGVYITECIGDAATQCFIYLHDSIQHTLEDVQITNSGDGDGGTGLAIKPIIISDVPSVVLRNVHTTGTYGCLFTENGAGINGLFECIRHNASPGAVYSFGYLLSLNHGWAGGQIRIRDISIANGGYLWEFGAQFDDPTIQIENFRADTWQQFSDLLIVAVNTGARPADEGRIMQMTGALGGTGNKYPLVTVAPTAGAQTKCVASASGNAIYFETGVNGGYGFVQVLGPGKRSNVQFAQNVGTGPVATQGDLVVHAAAGDGGVTWTRGDNAATYDKALGKLLGVLPANGVKGLVRLF